MNLSSLLSPSSWKKRGFPGFLIKGQRRGSRMARTSELVKPNRENTLRGLPVSIRISFVGLYLNSRYYIPSSAFLPTPSTSSDGPRQWGHTFSIALSVPARNRSFFTFAYRCPLFYGIITYGEHSATHFLHFPVERIKHSDSQTR